MKVLVCGSRHVSDEGTVASAIVSSGFAVSELVHGGCRGIDQMAGRWATKHGIAVRVFPADWATFGNSAGPRRNSDMVAYADCVVAIPRTDSIGTHDTIRKARARGIPVFVFEVSK